jgi:protein arginine kinase activator
MFIKPTLCSRCKKNIATVKLTKIIKGKVDVLNLCKDCAGEISPYQKKINEMQSNLSEILNKLIGGSAAEKPEQKAPGKKPKTVKATCRDCGLDFETYRESLFLGCADCYESFEKHLVPDLRRLHGSTSHVGKVPPGFRERYEQLKAISELQQELESLIEEEDFEKAAQLRDKIRSLKEQIESS